MKKNFNKGFTLIELLVVIAIIGILASVVLASLNSARNKGADAAIKASLTNARAQAELFYDAGTTYDNVCLSTGGANNIYPMVLGAAQKLASGNTPGTDGTAFTYSASGATGSAVCHDSPTAWASIVSLKSPSNTSYGWCVDSSGAAKEAASLGANATVCP